MPSNHCSNWDYHEWLREEFKRKKKVEATMFYCIRYEGKDDYFIGLSYVSEMGLCDPFCKVQVNSKDHLDLQEDGKRMRKLINLIIKMNPEIDSTIDFSHGKTPV
jgi:hypothetical protein